MASGLPLAVGDSIAGVCPGDYFVEVTDNLGCVYYDTLTTTTYSNMNISGTLNGLTCNGVADGSISLLVSGGTPPYTYLWSNGATTANLTNLAGGLYTVTVTDANGCTATSAASTSRRWSSPTAASTAARWRR